MKLLIVGASGHVGQRVLELALKDHRVSDVIAPVRSALPPQPKLQAPVMDFDHPPQDANWWQVDAVICALGTTLKAADSREAFRRVDHDYPLSIARIARQHQVPTFVLTSAIGANPDSRFFYNRVKGELERDLGGLGFQSLTYVRPGLLGGKRSEFRFGERMAQCILTLFAFLLPARWQISSIDQVAQSLLDAAVDADPGIHTVTSERLS